MDRIGFVILHYLSAEDTKRCINSIRKLQDKNHEIIVVDNGPDFNLEKQLKDSGVHILCDGKSRGFSAANNVGYLYAKDILKCNYIGLLNNDTELETSCCFDRLKEDVDRFNAAVIGPQIININQNFFNTNPKSTGEYSVSAEITKLFHKKINLQLGIFLSYLNMDLFFIGQRRRAMCITNKKKTPGIMFDIELHGSCLFFTPLYVEKHDGLKEVTFMYHEELILRNEMHREGMKMMYDPSITVKHMGGSSSMKIGKTKAQSRRIRYKRELESINNTLLYLSESDNE